MKVSEEEFIQIIRNNERQIQHLCRTYADRIEERKDLYQDIVLQVWRSLPSFNGEAQLSTWIYRLAINTAISFVRKKSTREEYHSAYKQEQEAGGGEVPGATYPSDESEEVGELYRAIASLNASEKAVITMYLEEFSYEQIAYAMDITENYVGVKLNRIKKKRSKILGE